MILPHDLSPEEATLFRQENYSSLWPLRNRFRHWVLHNSDVTVTAWQIRGLLLQTDKLGPTPSFSGDVLSEEASFMTRIVKWVAQCLGDYITYPGMKQATRDVQQIFPVPGFEDRQSAASSRTALQWHTEHADKGNPPSFLVLGCLRNPDGIGTRLSRPDLNQLNPSDIRTLSTAREFCFQKSQGAPDNLVVINSDGLRYDPVYCKPLTNTAREAFHRLTMSIEDRSCMVPQKPGTILIIPNRHTVHARECFHARFDGTDRWLLRSMVLFFSKYQDGFQN